MMRLFVAAIGAVMLAGPAAAAAQQMGAAVSAQAETAHYRLLLRIGPQEKMYSKADADKMHPASGEIMAGGMMAGMDMGTGMTMDMRHLEVHVVDRATGKVITTAACAITVTNDATKTSTAVSPVAMYGAKEGPSDWHYGNNVAMPPGSYTVKVAVNGEQAAFHVTIPKM